MALKAALAAACIVGMPGMAQAADPAANFANSNAHMTGDCQGRDASLAGSGNTVTIRGACVAFQIAGNGNRVLVAMAPGGTIKIYGSHNEVSWSGTGDIAVTTVGPDNTVSRAR